MKKSILWEEICKLSHMTCIVLLWLTRMLKFQNKVFKFLPWDVSMRYFVVFFVLPGVSFSSGSFSLHFGAKRFWPAAIAIRTRMPVIRTRMQIVCEDSRPRPSRLRPNSSNVGVERWHVYYLSPLRYLWEVVVITFTLPSAEKRHLYLQRVV